MDPSTNVVDMLMLLANEILASRHQINDSRNEIIELKNEIIELSKKREEDCRMLTLVHNELLLAKEDVRKTRQAMLSFFAMESELQARPDAEFEREYENHLFPHQI